LEKLKIFQTPKVDSFDNKQKIGSKIDSLWEENSLNQKKNRYNSKKLKIKLETNGIERSKLSLKLETNSPKVRSNNYNLLSELLKEFFNGKSDSKQN
jgi:hypothetical protein